MIFYLENPVLGKKKKKEKKKVELAGDTRLARQVAKLTCTLRFKMFTTGKKKSKKVKMFGDNKRTKGT